MPKDNEELVQAAFDGNTAKVRSLLEAGADINAMGRHWNPLFAAIENWQPEVISLLLRAGADIEFEHNGYRPIHHAIDVEIDAAIQNSARDYPQPVLTRLLLDFGADPKALNAEGQTPLLMAVQREHKKAAELLLERLAE